MKFLKYLRRKILIGCEKASSGCGFVGVVAQTILFSQYNVFLLGVNYFLMNFKIITKEVILTKHLESIISIITG